MTPEENTALESLMADGQQAAEGIDGVMQTPVGEPFKAFELNGPDSPGRRASREHIGAARPPDPRLSDGIEQGLKSPGFEDVRGSQDVNGAMITHTNQLTSTLNTMAQILMENCIKLEAIEAYFDKLR